MGRLLSFLYGVVSYFAFFLVFLYFIAFVGDFLVPKTVSTPPPTGGGGALAVDLLLIALFGVQHTIMARPGFKSWLTRWLPGHLERSTFVLVTSVLLAVIMWQWRAVDGVLWSVGGAVPQALLYGLFACGWGLIFVATFLTDHFDLFGLRQVYLHLRGRPYTRVEFKSVILYRWMRHPMMLGMLIGLWAIPTMTLSHLLFSAGMSLYIFVGISFEERGLLQEFGERYAEYRRSTSMLLPIPRGKADNPITDSTAA